MKSLLTLFASAAVCMLGAVAADAHHSYAAQFDRNQEVTFSGTVTKVEWSNPHARFYVTGHDPEMDGAAPVDWNIELVSANVLMRQGWGHNTLAVGDVVTVTATRARLDPHVVNSNTVTRDSGEVLFRRDPNQVNQ